jgi:hypothetical protein
VKNGGSKTAKKTARRFAPPSPRSGVQLPVGNHPGNTGGKKGRSGRKPDWFREWCEELLADPQSKQATEQIIRDKDHPARPAMVKLLVEHRYGKPSQVIGVATEGQKLEDLLAASRNGAEHG